MIQVEHLTCAYGSQTVLNAIDFHVGRGEMVGILGPNGSGKTTLLGALSGTLAPVAGKVRIEGQDVHALRSKTRARMMACVPQRLEPVFDMPVRSLVRMGRYPYTSLLRGYSGKDEEAVTWAMQTTNILHLGHRYANELSGGEWQAANGSGFSWPAPWPRKPLAFFWTKPLQGWMWERRWKSTTCSRPRTVRV